MCSRKGLSAIRIKWISNWINRVSVRIQNSSLYKNTVKVMNDVLMAADSGIIYEHLIPMKCIGLHEHAICIKGTVLEWFEAYRIIPIRSCK